MEWPHTIFALWLGNAEAMQLILTKILIDEIY